MVEPFPAKRSKPSAILFIGLNIVRTLSVLIMFLLFASQIWGCVKDAKAVRESDPDFDDSECDYYEFSSVPDQAGGLFWSILSRVFILIALCVLIPTEIHIPTKFLQRWYANNLPILSPLHGVGQLGAVQCWIAAVVLGKYVATFEQVVGWLGFIVGCLNMLIGVSLRSSSKERRKIFSWENVAQLTPQTKAAHAVYTTTTEKYDKFKPLANAVGGFVMEKAQASRQASSSNLSTNSRTELLPGHKNQDVETGSMDEAEQKERAYVEPTLPSDHSTPNATTQPGSRFGGFGFGKQREKSGGIEISRPLESLPRYVSNGSLTRPRTDA